MTEARRQPASGLTYVTVGCSWRRLLRGLDRVVLVGQHFLEALDARRRWIVVHGDLPGRDVDVHSGDARQGRQRLGDRLLAVRARDRRNGQDGGCHAGLLRRDPRCRRPYSATRTTKSAVTTWPSRV